MIKRPLAAIVLLAFVPPAPAEAQTPASPPPCSAPEHRQFDFWIGDWNVTGPDGRQAGRNRITAILDGCVLREEWTGAGGVSGTSYNIYDARSGRWHQTWVDGQGMLLLLDGGVDSTGAMVLENEQPGRDGKPLRNRITWTRIGPDEVRQLWETSGDGGSTWATVFDGSYRRVPAE